MGFAIFPIEMMDLALVVGPLTNAFTSCLMSLLVAGEARQILRAKLWKLIGFVLRTTQVNLISMSIQMHGIVLLTETRINHSILKDLLQATERIYTSGLPLISTANNGNLLHQDLAPFALFLDTAIRRSMSLPLLGKMEPTYNCTAKMGPTHRIGGYNKPIVATIKL